MQRAESKVRHGLSHHPVVYAIIGGTGVVLFWRGVWHTADLVVPLAMGPDSPWFPKSSLEILDGPLTLLVGIIFLLATGLFVSSLIGNEIIISGIKGEKRIEEKTEEEIKSEESEITRLKRELDEIKRLLEEERKGK